VSVELIEFDEAKTHLRLTGTNVDADLSTKVAAASAIVLNYLKIDFDASPFAWPWADEVDTPEEIPANVKAATLLVLGKIWWDREGAGDPLSDAARSLLHRYRDPAMA
jgi:hypothetical protein